MTFFYYYAVSTMTVRQEFFHVHVDEGYSETGSELHKFEAFHIQIFR